MGLSGSTPGSSPGPARMKAGGLPPTKTLAGLTKKRDHPLREKHKPYAAVHRVPKPVKERGGPKQQMIRERNSDLRATFSASGSKLKRWFREGELLWCTLDAPIRGKDGDQSNIEFWPGVVQEVILKPEAIPRPVSSSNGDVEMGNGTGGDTISSTFGQNQTSKSDDDGDGDSPTPWTVRQSVVYKMKFLAVDHTAILPVGRLLPYQAYAMPSELYTAIENFPLDQVDINKETIAAFDPRPPPEGVDNGYARFEEAVGPFTMAVQIASALSGYWCPTDEWDFKFTVGPSSIPSIGRPLAGSSSLSLSSAIAAASANNAALHTTLSSGVSPYGASQTASGSKSQDDLNLRILGQPPPHRPIAQTVTQLRYQGLWWGAERIWTDELVRLKPSRAQLAPEGTQDIYPPSGPSKKTLEDYLASDDPDPATDLTAGSRGVFMRVEGLFVVDAVKEDGTGTRKECRACGMLYELADEDWEEDQKESKAVNDGTESSLQQSSQMNSSMGPPPQGPLSLPPSASVAPLSGAQPVDVSSKIRSPNVQLSRPILSIPTELPTPPRGFKFRPILAHGREAVMSLSLIAGRYYPLLLAHPLLAPLVEKVLGNTLEEGGLLHEHHLWSLEGLTPGFFNSVDPVKVKPSRTAMLREADKTARNLLEQVREEQILRGTEKVQMDLQMDTDYNNTEEQFRQMDVDEVL
jgi:hypothetical protein